MLNSDIQHANVTLQLPPTMKCHPIFHSLVIKPYYAPNLFYPSRQSPSNPPPIITEDGFKEYSVECILDHKHDQHGQIYYLIRWEGYDESYDTWEPEHNLTNATEILRNYLCHNSINSIIHDARGGVINSHT